MNRFGSGQVTTVIAGEYWPWWLTITRLQITTLRVKHFAQYTISKQTSDSPVDDDAVIQAVAAGKKQALSRENSWRFSLSYWQYTWIPVCSLC